MICSLCKEHWKDTLIKKCGHVFCNCKQRCVLQVCFNNCVLQIVFNRIFRLETENAPSVVRTMVFFVNYFLNLQIKDLTPMIPCEYFLHNNLFFFVILMMCRPDHMWLSSREKKLSLRIRCADFLNR